MSPSTPRFSPPRQGVALVVVLSLVVLLTALVLAFISSARNDLIVSTHHEAGQQAQNLAETASDVVISQIREATTSGISGGVGEHAWASQPGAIRVWDNTGNLVQLYKLYSAAQLKETDLSFLASEVPSDWRDRPEEYVNINEPVATQTGPVSTWHFPVLNPIALGQVDGFSSQQIDDPGIPWNTQTSMPVHWLYVGRGGALSTSLEPDSIGRIAFWTDDETCKVNINTASASASKSTIAKNPPNSSSAGSANSLGYSYWDRPYTQFVQDWNMALSGPSQGEYQRYPGHPAGVNLLTVFSGSALAALSESTQKTILQNAFELFPAYRWGGSENSRYPWQLTSSRMSVSGTNQRLYASVDELQFQSGVSGVLRDTNSLPDGSGSDASRLDSWRFFLTAHSRAPDLNLFGQPRVTIWPLHDTDDTLHRTTQDKLIAFCSTYGNGAGKREYFFTRKNPLSQTEDWTGIDRNRALFSYLRDMTSRNIPGFPGGNFLQKYDTGGGVSGERDQILTEIFDYIRCVNLNEAFEFKPAGFESYTPTIDVPPSAQMGTAYNDWNDANYGSYAGAGMVLPILINTYSTRGAGRVPVLSEVALFAMQEYVHPPPPPAVQTPPEPTNELQTALFFETFSPMQGYMPWTPKDFQLQVNSDILIEGEPVFPDADTTGATTIAFNRSLGRNNPNLANNWVSGAANQPIGGTDGFAWTIVPYPNYNHGVVLGYPFGRDRSNAIPLPSPVPSPVPSPAKFNLSAGTVQAALKMNGNTYQSYNLNFDAASLSIPQEGPSSGAYPWPILDWILRVDSKGMKFGSKDIVHSIVPKDGDYRIIAYLQNVPSGFFEPHPDYYSDKYFAHSLRQGRNSGQWGTTGINDGTTNGSFVGLPHRKESIPLSNDAYFWTDHPDIPPDITDLIAAGWTGDWDSGLGDFPDGAYLGKADDGVRLAANAVGNFSANYFGPGFGWYSGAGFYSPTQQMPSAVVFGSLPTGVKRTAAAYSSGNDGNATPWRTLLFCPNPALGGTHFGFESPPDSLLLDLFTMPVVEPFAISEPSSTAGRINLNYQILPFTSLERSTGLHAVFSAQRVTAIPDTHAQTKHGSAVIGVQATIQSDTTRIRHRIDVPETLKQFTARFAANDIFRSATEICSLFLVPEGETLASTPGWWNSHQTTGDNLRERPYATTYPLLTTKSNTYTVHVLAQSLAPGTNTVTGEYRGSTMIERYLDPEDSRLTTAANDPDTKSLEPLYRFRVIETKRFAP